MGYEAVVKGVLVLGFVCVFVSIAGYFMPKREEQPPQQGGPMRGGRGRRQRQAQAAPQGEEDQQAQQEQLIRQLQKMSQEGDYAGLAEMFEQMRMQTTDLQEAFALSLMEASYRYQAGHHEKGKKCVMDAEKLVGRFTYSHQMNAQIIELAMSFDYHHEAEQMLGRVLLQSRKHDTPATIAHFENLLANTYASSNRLPEARTKMESVKKIIGSSNPPLAVSSKLVTEDAQFVLEDGKIMCKLTFKRNSGTGFDLVSSKAPTFAKGFTMKCLFQHPESGKPAFEKTSIVQRSNMKEHNIAFEYPSIKKGLYLVEIDMYEDDEAMESIGRHLVLCQADFDK